MVQVVQGKMTKIPPQWCKCFFGKLARLSCPPPKNQDGSNIGPRFPAHCTSTITIITSTSIIITAVIGIITNIVILVIMTSSSITVVLMITATYDDGCYY